MNKWRGQYRSYDAPDTALVGRLWCSSSGPELKCTTIAEVELQTNWNQSKPSTRSEGEEAATEMPDRRPEAREFWVGTPEFITQSKETEERAVLPLNTAETGTSQKVAIQVMEGESKERCRTTAAFGGATSFRAAFGFRLKWFGITCLAPMAALPSRNGGANLQFVNSAEDRYEANMADIVNKISSKPSLKKSCEKCRKRTNQDGKGFSFCASCKVSCYCSREFQTGHWKEHKGMCKTRMEHAEIEQDLKAHAALSGGFFVSQATLQNWYYDNVAIVDYAVRLGLLSPWPTKINRDIIIGGYGGTFRDLSPEDVGWNPNLGAVSTPERQFPRWRDTSAGPGDDIRIGAGEWRVWAWDETSSSSEFGGPARSVSTFLSEDDELGRGIESFGRISVLARTGRSKRTVAESPREPQEQREARRSCKIIITVIAGSKWPPALEGVVNRDIDNLAIVVLRWVYPKESP
ncbi:hypothetical protein B0H14DRAFT_3130191 [Mycena olivaceomarginata]|nr:hypothetical protein B0H14DRAFT_3130191 [Mycena olivaceomarginata]